MAIIVDGYNFISAAAITVDHGAYSLEKSRQALVRFLVAVLTDKERRSTTIVFDGRNAPPGLPDSYQRADVKIVFARRHEDADTVIGRLIQADHHPRSLTVVSSDHAIQRDARRRKCRAVDSEVWYAEMVRRARSKNPLASATPEEDQITEWLQEFGLDADSAHEVGDREEHPFPPGYGEDLLDPPSP